VLIEIKKNKTMKIMLHERMVSWRFYLELRLIWKGKDIALISRHVTRHEPSIPQQNSKSPSQHIPFVSIYEHFNFSNNFHIGTFQMELLKSRPENSFTIDSIHLFIQSYILNLSPSKPPNTTQTVYCDTAIRDSPSASGSK
jgi:hypothetical protein